MGKFTDGFRPAATGEFTPGVAAAQFPDVKCRSVKLKARAANTGRVAIGLASTVTLSNGATDTTTGWELAAGEEMDLIVGINNLNDLYAIGAGASDSLLYWTYR